MSFVWVGWLALALVAAAFAVLYLLQRRELKAIGHLSQEVQRIAIGGRLGGRVEVEAPSSEVSALTTAINVGIAQKSPHTHKIAAPSCWSWNGGKVTPGTWS